MNIFNISSELKFVNRIGQTLSTDERISLELNVLKLSEEYHYEIFNFWGRVEGVSKNYYIVQGVNFKGATKFPAKKYFWRYCVFYTARKILSSPNCHRREMSMRTR